MSVTVSLCYRCENHSLKERCQYLLRDLEKLNEEITDAANALRCSPAMFCVLVEIESCLFVL